jgi:organic radical activating enzyme
MCSSVFSSEWIKIEKKEKGESKYKPWNFSNKQVIELAKYIKDVERIVVKGGEPMYNPRFPLFLKELANYKTERDFILFTNLSIIQHEALEYIQQFRLGDQQPYIQASLESCDEDYYKLIRGGKDTSFKNFITNFRTIKENYPKIGIRIHFLINGWTLHRLKEDIDILLDNGVTQINFDTIFGPEEQSFVTQNHSCRKKAIMVLEDIIEKYPRLVENKQEILNNFKTDHVTNYNKGYNIMRTKELYNRRLLQGVKFDKTYNEIFGTYLENHV